MRFAVLLVPLVAGCLWVTTEEVDESFDKDEDGWGLGEDCNDANDQVYPYAPDWRGDGCDADCNKEPDADGDDWPDDTDCAPDDETVYPCSIEGTSGDIDCDGIDGISRPDGDCDYARPDPDFPDDTPQIDEGACDPPPSDDDGSDD